MMNEENVLKLLKIIDSCETEEQFQVAVNCAIVAHKNGHISDGELQWIVKREWK